MLEELDTWDASVELENMRHPGWHFYSNLTQDVDQEKFQKIAKNHPDLLRLDEVAFDCFRRRISNSFAAFTTSHQKLNDLLDRGEEDTKKSNMSFEHMNEHLIRVILNGKCIGKIRRAKDYTGWQFNDEPSKWNKHEIKRDLVRRYEQ